VEEEERSESEAAVVLLRFVGAAMTASEVSGGKEELSSRL